MRSLSARPSAAEPWPRADHPRSSGVAVALAPRAAVEAVAGGLELEAESEPRSPLDMAPPPRVPGPRPVPKDPWMTPSGNGTYRFDHSGFTAHVERDGHVTFDDKPSFQPFVEGPCLDCVKESAGKYVEDPSAGYTIDLLALIPKVGARFDLTDWVMRKVGDDPYSYEKARFLDATRARREGMSRTETEERLREALQTLPKHLAEIWTYEEWTRAERKRVLFDLWDECAETGSDDRIRLGRAIRATIVGFIRRRAPEHSADAYTSAELDALNRGRKSKERFAPYDDEERDPALDE